MTKKYFVTAEIVVTQQFEVLADSIDDLKNYPETEGSLPQEAIDQLNLIVSDTGETKHGDITSKHLKITEVVDLDQALEEWL